jgi:hypothetical protein
MRIRVTSDALDDLDYSYAFYEKQEKGIGSYFRECIEQDLNDLRRTAGIHSKIKGYLHVNSKIFNSIFYYRMEPGAAIVIAILDGRIHPYKRNQILKTRS